MPELEGAVTEYAATTAKRTAPTFIERMAELAKDRKAEDQQAWDARVAASVELMLTELAVHEGGKLQEMIKRRVESDTDRESTSVLGREPLATATCVFDPRRRSDNAYANAVKAWLKKNDLEGLNVVFEQGAMAMDRDTYTIIVSWSFNIP